MKENSIEDIIEEKYTRYLNFETDILELTIEEAIFILEKDKKNHYVEDLLRKAYKVILSDYKRVLKENEELKDKYAIFVKMSSEVIANSIPVQKVKDKIEEYKRCGLYEEDRYVFQEKINALQELLESEE